MYPQTARDKLKADLTRAVDEFLRSGGKIRQIPTGVSGLPPDRQLFYWSEVEDIYGGPFDYSSWSR